jgi:hypothetical protein
MRTLYKIFCILFVLMLSVPLLQTKFEFIKFKKLVGVTAPTELSRWNLSTWHSGDWQKNTSDWLDKNIGFRNTLVRTDNQLNYELFRELSASAQSPLVLGKNNYIFEKGYIDNLNNRDRVSTATLIEQVDQYIELERQLQARGITLVLLIAPTKPSIHRDLVPDRYILESRRGEPTNYERLAILLNERGVSYIDGHRLFIEWQKGSAHTMFATGGTHWGYVGLCRLNQVLIDTIVEKTSKNLTKIDCEPTIIERELYSANRDLLDLANLLDESDFITPTPYPRVSNNFTGAEWQPKILFVGDSYLWTLTAMLRDNHVYTDQQMYYYFNTATTYPGELSEKMDRYGWDWESRVLNQDVIVIEASETAVNDIGFGFMDLLLEHLDKHPKI